MPENKLRFFIVGLGSMGKRRIRNLQANGERDIAGFDIRPDRNKEAGDTYGIKTVDSFEALSPEEFDALIISTSPEAHGDYIRFALKHNKHFFVEHPVSTDGYRDIFAYQGLDIVKAPSCTPRYLPALQTMKQILDSGRIGKILAFQHHMGQYLPDWHPWEDYREVYFSKKATSACREMLPFELIGINWLMGSKIAEISGEIAKISDLDMDADDIILATAKYHNGIRGSLIIDVISRKPLVMLSVLGSEGVLEWDKFGYTIKVFDVKSRQTEIINVPQGRPEPGYVNPEEPYIQEIKAFLRAIRGEAEYPHTFADNLQLLETLFALIESSRTGRAVAVKRQ